jgi:membrane protease YdiL (CAAX protease family)
MSVRRREIDQKFTVISYAAAMFVGTVLSAVVAATVDASTPLYLYLGYLLPQTAYITVFALMWRVKYGMPFGELVDKRDVKPVQYLFALLIGVGTLLFALLPNTYITELIKNAGSGASVNVPDMTEWYDYILGIVIICVLPAIGEELIFRKAFCDGMKDVADYKTVLLCGFMFAMAHLNLAQTVHQFFLGCVLGYVYVKTKNITLTMTIHFVNNLLALYLERITGAEFWNNITVAAVSCAVGFALLFAGLALVFKTGKKLDNTKKGRIETLTAVCIVVIAFAWVVCAAMSFMKM